MIRHAHCFFRRPLPKTDLPAIQQRAKNHLKLHSGQMNATAHTRSSREGHPCLLHCWSTAICLEPTVWVELERLREGIRIVLGCIAHHRDGSLDPVCQQTL